MLPLFVSHLISINCFPLQWICLLKRIHPACIYSYTAQHFSCQQTDTSLFTQLESGLFFCFLETSLRSAIILSLMKTVAPAERNSTYVFNTAHVVLVPKEIFFTPLNLLFQRGSVDHPYPFRKQLVRSNCFFQIKLDSLLGAHVLKTATLVTLRSASGQLEEGDDPAQLGTARAPNRPRQCLLLGLVLSGLSLQRLEAGLQFPGQRLRSGWGSEDTESWPLDHQGEWPVTRPWALWLRRNDFLQRREVVKQEKCLLGRKRVCVDRHMGGLKESCPCGSLHPFMGLFFWVFFDQSFCFAWLWAHIWFISGSSHACTLIS